MPTVRVAAKFITGRIEWELTTAVATASKDWDALGGSFNSAVTSQLMPLLSSQTEYQGSMWSDFIEKTAAGILQPAGIGMVGGVAQPSLPPLIAATVTLFTGVYGRGKSGRWFLSGLPITYVDGGLLISDSRIALQTAVDAFTSALVAADIVPHVATWNRTTRPATFVGTQPVLNYYVRPVLHQQRRRQFGVSIGPHPSRHRT
jgi:hypothetical protein